MTGKNDDDAIEGEVVGEGFGTDAAFLAGFRYRGALKALGRRMPTRCAH